MNAGRHNTNVKTVQNTTDYASSPVATLRITRMPTANGRKHRASLLPALDVGNLDDHLELDLHPLLPFNKNKSSHPMQHLRLLEPTPNPS